MVSNPIIIHQLLVLLLCGMGVMVVGQHLLAGLGLYGNRIAAFRLRLVGQIGFYGGIGLALFISIAAIATTARSGLILTAAALLASLTLTAMSHYARIRYRSATLRALGSAEDLAPFEALAIYRAYATNFPGSPEPMTKLLSDLAGLRLLLQMHEEGVRFEGKPIPDKVGEWCMNSGPTVVKRALEIGMFSDNQSLENMMQRQYQEGCELEWEGILTRREGSLTVGQVIREMLEEAIARQNPRVAVEMLAPALDSNARLALHNIIQRATEHLARVRLELIPYMEDAPPDQPEPTYRIVLEVLDVGQHKLTYSDTETSSKAVRSTTMRGSLVWKTEHKLKEVTKDAFYPLISMRCSVLRNASKVVSVEADSRAGLEIVMQRNVAKMGGGPTSLAANIIFGSIVQGSGMLIRESKATGQNRPALPSPHLETTSDGES